MFSTFNVLFYFPLLHTSVCNNRDDWRKGETVGCRKILLYIHSISNNMKTSKKITFLVKFVTFSCLLLSIVFQTDITSFFFNLPGPERRTRRHCRCMYESSTVRHTEVTPEIIDTPSLYKSFHYKLLYTQTQVFVHRTHD